MWIFLCEALVLPMWVFMYLLGFVPLIFFFFFLSILLFHCPEIGTVEMSCLIMGYMTKSATWGMKIEVLPQCGQVFFLHWWEIWMFKCKFAGVHSHVPALPALAVQILMFLGYQWFGHRVRIGELDLPSLCSFGIFLMKTSVRGLNAGVMVLGEDGCPFLVHAVSLKVFQATVCSQFTALLNIFTAYECLLFREVATSFLNGSWREGTVCNKLAKQT